MLKIFDNKDNTFSIKKEANIYFQRDEFAIILDQIIKKYNNDPQNNMTNMDKLGFITKYNPYYIEPKYSSKVDCEIFESFDLNNCKEFSQFRSMNFEIIFKNNISDYIKKFMEKVKNISDFNVVLRLINIRNIDNNEDKYFYLNQLITKYDEKVNNEIGLLTKTKLNEAIHLVSCLAIINYIYGKEKEKFNFMNKKIKNIDDKDNKIISLILNEIANICFIKEENKNDNEDGQIKGEEEFENNILENDFKNNDFNELKNFLYDEFSNNIEKEGNIANIIDFIDCLKEIDKKNNDKKKMQNEFLSKLITKNMFTKEEFFSNKENKKITLIYKLYDLYKKDKEDLEIIKKNYENILDDISEDIKGNIIKSKLEAFLKNDRNLVERRLELINITVPSLRAKDKYDELKKYNDEMNIRIKELKDIKDNIIIYYKESYQETIKNIKKLIDTNQNTKIEHFKKGGKFGEIKENEIDNLKNITKKIKEVKDLILFNVLYDLNTKRDEDSKFSESYEKLKKIKISLKELNDLKDYDNIDDKIAEGLNKLNIEYKEPFNLIKKKLCNNKEDAEKFIGDLKKYYELNNTDLINNLEIFFKSKKYELDIKSIIFFFEYNFDKDKWNEKLLKKEFEKKWEEDFKNIKNDLDKLNKNNIYDYKNTKPQYYNNLFTCLYEKEEAIDFLFKKTSDEIIKLKDKIQPTDTTINIKHIIDTDNCVKIINRMKGIETNSKKFEFITTLEDHIIDQFINYSKIYSSVIELYTDNDEFSDNVYLNVVRIIKDATFNILQDNENFMYDQNKNITMKELIHLKNQIHIKNDMGSNEDDIIKSKCKILSFFKDVISKLEIIIAYMSVLRKKGSSLPITISIKIKAIKNEKEEIPKIPKIEYYLDKFKKEFEEIREFLFDAKNAYISQLNSIYKEKLNLRFLYGKQLRIIMRHIIHNYKIDSFLRYILNNTDNNSEIKEGDKYIERNVYNYIDDRQYIIYSRNSLDGISNYITSLFEKNNKTIEDHYKNMTIISPGYKGIYINECSKNEKEKFIINLFKDKINQLPIAQNVLITNKETSSEEVQSFFHRSILCNYNTLFVVEMNDSFSDYQQSRMNAYIDSLLTYKNNEYNEYNKNKSEKVDKAQTQKYLESCIVFVYDNENKNIVPFIKEIEKFKSKVEVEEGGKKKLLILDNDLDKLDKFLEKKKCKNNFIDNYLQNILVITSDICGLGKSEEIKHKINNKKYFHFPLGGSLTKSIIYDKLNKLLFNITNEMENNNLKYEDIAIHLDLTESKETSIINEFFFSFLITRFYTNNENIIYIPKDIKIFIEVPNCFKDYLSKFSILTIFKRENITLESIINSESENENIISIKMPPFSYDENITNTFKNMIGKSTNPEIEEYVKKYISEGDKKSKYSYHQINIFVKLFITQCGKYNTKIRFLDPSNNVITEDIIKEFAKSTQYFTNGSFSKLLTGSIQIKKKKMIDKLSKVYENDLKNIEFKEPLIFIHQIKGKLYHYRLCIDDDNLEKYKNSLDYLLKLKEIMNLPQKANYLLSLFEEENNNYVITNDNFKKMALLYYRIVANVPVIIMGDTGCGKTALITKLNQILNGGETKIEIIDEKTGKKRVMNTLKIINIHPAINDEDICQQMEEANNIAEELKKHDKELWLFFDEMNTCMSLSLLTEIFINRNYKTNEINSNIKLIGACNPYRKRKKNKEKCGLSMSDDNENELVYLVQPFPQSLLYYVFSFGSIDKDDEKKYISSILEKSFTKDENYLHEITKEAISECHIYLREKYDPSVVSLREIARFTKCIEFFEKYFEIKNEIITRNNNPKNNKLRSIICSIYICYYIRLTNQKIRFDFDAKLKPILLKLVNNEKNIKTKGTDLIYEFDNEELVSEIRNSSPNEKIEQFSDFLKIEQDFLINQIELDDGIGKNALLKENVFLLFLSLVTNIPLIIIGKPGTGKSLSAKLIYKSMKGKYSKNNFFKKFPRIIQIYFQGSESTHPLDVKRLFRKAESKSDSIKKKYKEENNKEVLPIIMVLFDELGLAERSTSNPLKVLHEKLEYSGKKEGVSFVGISNYTLDAAKINRALVLSVPDLDENLDDLKETSKNIVQSISSKIKDDKVFKIVSKTYFEYKQIIKLFKELVVYKQYLAEKRRIKGSNQKVESSEDSDTENMSETHVSDSKATSSKGERNEKNTEIQKQEKEKKTFDSIKRDKLFKEMLKKEKKIRNDFHGNRDFYSIIREIAIQLKSADISEEDKVKIIIKFIERNFGGIEYEINLDLNNIPEDLIKTIELIKEIFEGYIRIGKNKEIINLSSVYLFKFLYNKECDIEEKESKLKIDEKKLNDYDLNKCINDNIKDTNSRYLLLEIKPSLTNLICENIKLQNQDKDKIELYDGSSFVDDNNKDYRFRIINKIQEDAKENKLIIIENLNQIHPFLFDLYNKNYIIKNEKKLVRICLENFNEQLTEVNDEFRVIILEDKRFVDKCDLAFLNRLEKMILSFDKLLDDYMKRISENLIKEFRFEKTISMFTEINYSLKDLLINCGDEEIQALIYYFSKELKKKDREENEDDEKRKNDETEKIIKEKVYNKIYKILPQDIICILQDNNIIRLKYNQEDNEIYYNYNEYIAKGKIEVYKISIIYTFTGITNIVEGLNKEMSFMVSEIRSEEGLRRMIEEIKNKNEKNFIKKYIICIDFEQSNSKKIKFISNFILKNYENDNYHYIFIIHIKRNIIQKISGKLSNDDNKGKINKKIINEKIYSLPDINKNINQMFIDNLNGNNIINLKNLLNGDIIDLLEKNKEQLKLNEEFNKTLTNVLRSELFKKESYDNIIDDFLYELQQFLNIDDIKKEIFNVIYNLIKKNNSNETNINDIIKKLFENGSIDKYTIDISSCIIKYIKDKIFNRYIKQILIKLEDNNILSTLYESQKNKFKEIDKEIVKEIIIKYLRENIEEKNEEKPNYKFLFNYNVPGLYNFYKDFSNYLNKNITSIFFNNEKKLRETKKNDGNSLTTKFHETQDDLITKANKYFLEHKFFSFVVNKNSLHCLIFNDYITYYLQKYRNNNDIYKKNDIYHKLISLLLKLRFNFKENENNINELLMKMIWIESNVNYILNILKIFDIASNIFDSNDLYNKIEENEKKIKYVTSTDRNPEHTKEVNECFYKLLASICYIIVPKDINLTFSKNNKNNNSIDIDEYHYNLSEINKILQNLEYDLYLYLNEMYIIDELIKIIELFMKKNNIEKIISIKNLLRENALIIQEYSGEDNKEELSDKLKTNFEEMYNIIIKEELIDKNDNDYYDKLRYIYFKEIRKLSNPDYRYNILEKILESDEIIKNSKEILQLLLRNYVKSEYSGNLINNILNGSEKDYNIINLLDKKINNNFVLGETLLYFFEKSALNYFYYKIGTKKEITNKEKKKETFIIKLDNEPLSILKDCYGFLNFYLNKFKIVENKLKEICKLFCLGYIKSYIHTFIKSFEEQEEEENQKFNDPVNIINVINENDPIYKMMRIYIYKILYNNFGVDIFIDKKMIKKYRLDLYTDFGEFIQTKELYNMSRIEYTIRTLENEKFNEANSVITDYTKEEFKKGKINKQDFDLEDYGVDNFYVISYNLVLSNLHMENRELEFNKKFFENICNPLFEEDELLYRAIELFLDQDKYQKIKKSFKFNTKNIKSILFGYRYCLNELYLKNTKGIYYPLYKENYLKHLTDYFFPGNDTKCNDIYSNIINHFKIKPKEGCYVCLCQNGFYHSVKYGFPGYNELNKFCPKCSKNIGAVKKGLFFKEISIVNRKNYYRIFESEKEINDIKNNEYYADKLDKINYMTIDEYKEKYIMNDKNIKKGIFTNNDKNNFRNDEKIIRNLSQITFRILNYILYSHLFFARLITNKKEVFDEYLPKGLGWVETLSECWNILKNELSKENVDSIEKFMSYIFSDLFPILNKAFKINKCEDLIIFEDELNSKIKDMIEKYKIYNENLQDNNKNDEDKNSFVSLLKETYTNYPKKEFPFYEYFYYTDYLDEKYIIEKLSHMKETKYPVLQKYLESKNNKMDNLNYSLDNLYLFNNVLNLINENYYNKISRVSAEKNEIKDEEIYKINSKIIDKFIDFINSFKFDKVPKLSINNHISDFLLTDNNFFNTYKKIYKEFAKIQNEKLEKLLDIKMNMGIFDTNCKNKIYIQQIKEDEIFNLKLPKNISFIDIIFNSSYRKIIDHKTRNKEFYREYEINYDLIEENMTELLLKNKKMLKEDINEFVYNDEVFENQVTNLICSFANSYKTNKIDNIDKFIIYKYYKEKQNSKDNCKKIIADFIKLIQLRKDKIEKKLENNEISIIVINEKTQIYEIVSNLKEINYSDDFIRLFEKHENLTFNKASNIFKYYLKLIFELVKDDLKTYQIEIKQETKDAIQKYYEIEKEKGYLIKKKDLARAIRLFTTLVLFLEDDKNKEKKIKNNFNNAINYLKPADLWESEIYDDKYFNQKLDELKSFNININQIISLYETIGKEDIKDNFCEDFEKRLKEENSKNNQQEEEMNEEDPFAINEEEEENNDDSHY